MHHVFKKKNNHIFYIWNLKAAVEWGKTQVLLITLGDQCDSEPSHTKPGVHVIKVIYQHCLDPDRKRWRVSCVSLMFWIADAFVSIAEQLNGRVRLPNHGVCFVVWKNISRNELISEIAACVLQIWWNWPLRPKQLKGIQPLFILIFTPGLFLLWHVKTSSVKFLLVDRVTGHRVLTRLESASLYVQSL